jgi:SAM-dependent methyltransferase
MTLQVLQNKEQIRAARAKLEARGLSSLPSALKQRFAATVARFGVAPPLVLGDFVKSWDLLTSIEFLENNVSRNSAILDIGAYASEILVALKKAGFTNLTGVDLNPRLNKMPYQDEIKYVTSDFMTTPFADASFDAVTSISVIEHGFDPERLMKETARILRPGGYFVASFDYWREKIDTGNTRFFGMDWLIFSEQDVAAMLAVAAKYGLEPVGALHPETADRAIEHGGYHYTFGWMALQRRP